MRVPVYISAMAVQSPLAKEPAALYRALMQGECALTPTTRFNVENYTGPYSATIKDLDHPRLESAAFDLLDALLDGFPRLPSDTQVILASAKGALDILEQQTRREESHMASSGEPEKCLHFIQQKLGLKNPGLFLSAACASSTVALAKAVEIVSLGMYQQCLVIGFEILTEFIFSGFSCLGAASEGICRPFDQRRNGLNLGEGAAALLITASPDELEGASMDGESPITVAGTGVSTDATHITAPARDACGLIRAIRQALDDAEMTPEYIGGVIAHGTGTVYNDAMELTALNAVFGKNIPPFASIKGATGHTLGAAGAIELVVSAQSLWNGAIPPTCGCEQPEPMTQGMARDTPQFLSAEALLKINSGFGGINAAIILRKERP